MEAIRRGEWMQGLKSLGALANPGENFFLETVAECIRLDNAEVDDNKMTWAKESMVLCGLDLSKPMQDIIQRHHEEFEKGFEESSASAQV
ncbi:hypothetical protein PHMEG_00023893 [Phytophthora megakarya]|uniref:Uncharacterized protein n=1 Tax=Phytophthora megakarya TaxID=4795 RepID=A0A225VFU2_9STRA|nr:hypothetical protein PHMEG_00023893 [Phytophthora megakarya]